MWYSSGTRFFVFLFVFLPMFITEKKNEKQKMENMKSGRDDLLDSERKCGSLPSHKKHFKTGQNNGRHRLQYLRPIFLCRRTKRANDSYLQAVANRSK